MDCLPYGLLRGCCTLEIQINYFVFDFCFMPRSIFTFWGTHGLFFFINCCFGSELLSSGKSMDW